MRAVVCKEFGPPESLALEEVEAPVAGKGQVLIDVRAVGLNFPDTLQIEGKYQFQPPFPFTPASEVSGMVAAVGDGVNRVKVGDRVMAMPGIGGLAEQVVAEEGAVFVMPEAMDFATAAGFSMVYGTSYYALVRRGRYRAGETVLVLGAAGGVGLAAVDIAKALGARVIAAAGSDEKLQVARGAGADETINYNEVASFKDAVKELTDGDGIDITVDVVGGELTEQALRGTGWGGRLLILGFTSGTIPKLPANLMLLKSCEVVGVFWGAYRMREPKNAGNDFSHLFELYGQGKLKPLVSQRFPLEKYADALNLFQQRKAVGKVIVEVS